VTDRVRSLFVATTQGLAGVLIKDGQHVFNYDREAIAQMRAERSISLTMPIRADSWKTTPMLPVFQTFLPEGFLREHIKIRFGKTIKIDDMALLALTGENAIGRIRATLNQPLGPSHANSNSIESLKEILSDQGARDLFEYLCNKYLLSTSIAGVQPKVVVPVEGVSIGERSTLRMRQFIVKVSSADYPNLSENEYHCLSIAKACGNLIEVPSIHLSADFRRLAIERFDLTGDGQFLGFEDMVALQGKVNDDKYEGSYENIAATIRLNCSPLWVARSLERFFASVVLAVVLRNGDAHLKNFGLLYTDPSTDDCRLSPIFDQVCTTLYIPGDSLALRLARSKAWPNRKTLESFGRQRCELAQPGIIVDQILDAIAHYRPDLEGPAWPPLNKLFEDSVMALG
jgi:serine/threonine-protein kinase HipA